MDHLYVSNIHNDCINYFLWLLRLLFSILCFHLFGCDFFVLGLTAFAFAFGLPGCSSCGVSGVVCSDFLVFALLGFALLVGSFCVFGACWSVFSICRGFVVFSDLGFLVSGFFLIIITYSSLLVSIYYIIIRYNILKCVLLCVWLFTSGLEVSD